jgi:hypothetical protein
MGAPNTFEYRRQELAELHAEKSMTTQHKSFTPSDDDVVASFLGKIFLFE